MLLEAGALQILLSHFERGVPVSFSVLQKHSFHSCLIRAVGQNLNWTSTKTGLCYLGVFAFFAEACFHPRLQGFVHYLVQKA